MSAAIAIEYINHAFHRKYRGVPGLVLCLAGGVFYFLVVTLLNRFSGFEGLAGLSYGFVLFLYGIVALEGNKTDFMIFSLIWVVIALVSAYIMFGILGIVTGEGIGALLERSGNQRTYSALAAGALKFSMGRIVLAAYKKKGKEIRTEDWVMGGIFLLMFALVLGMFRLETGNLSQMQRYYLSLQILGGMFGMAVILSAFYRILDKYREERLEQEYLAEEQIRQAEQLHDLYQFGREANHMRHDMKIKLDTVYALLEKEGYEEAKMCVRKLGAEWGNRLEMPRDTGNEGLNAALMKAAQRCQEKDVRFHYVVIGRPVEINSMDMGNLVDNLLRNGIEACEGQDGTGQVEIVIRKENGVVEIEMENTIRDSVLRTNPEMKSTKPGKERHGFGMESIRKIIGLYHGKYTCWEEQEEHVLWFTQSICLKVQKNPEEKTVPLQR
ncbi:MAG: GHKL domain-containing protein [Lachnospiraceae bacterium]|nr:GHKL domain-containing protein [Lachnospiraceae bacterium]